MHVDSFNQLDVISTGGAFVHPTFPYLRESNNVFANWPLPGAADK